MLSKEVARKILPLVNSIDFKDFSAYIEYRRDLAIHKLRNAKSIEEVYTLQGQLIELDRLDGLRDEAIADSKDDK